MVASMRASTVDRRELGARVGHLVSMYCSVQSHHEMTLSARACSSRGKPVSMSNGRPRRAAAISSDLRLSARAAVAKVAECRLSPTIQRMR